MGEAVDYFVQNALLSDDNLIAVTPIMTYKKDKGLETKPREEIAEELKGLIRKGAFIGDSEYRGALKELMDLPNVVTRLPSGVPGGQYEAAELHQPIC